MNPGESNQDEHNLRIEDSLQLAAGRYNIATRDECNGLGQRVFITLRLSLSFRGYARLAASGSYYTGE
jgi:hypothetical protein